MPPQVESPPCVDFHLALTWIAAQSKAPKGQEKHTAISINRRRFSGAVLREVLHALGIKRCSIGDYGQGEDRLSRPDVAPLPACVCAPLPS